MNDELYQNIKSYLDTIVDTNVTLDTLGIDSGDFKDELRGTIMSRIQDVASEKIEN